VCGTLQNVTHYKNIHNGALQCPALLLPLAGQTNPRIFGANRARRFFSWVCCWGIGVGELSPSSSESWKGIKTVTGLQINRVKIKETLEAVKKGEFDTPALAP